MIEDIIDFVNEDISTWRLMYSKVKWTLLGVIGTIFSFTGMTVAIGNLIGYIFT